MKSLLTLTALFEITTGLVLIAIPSITVSLLLGPSLTEPSGILVARVGGAALITLAIICWLSRNDAQSSIVTIKALVFYNLATVILLVYAGAVEHFSGLGLWPAVLLHLGLLGWCLKSIVSKPSTK